MLILGILVFAIGITIITSFTTGYDFGGIIEVLFDARTAFGFIIAITSVIIATSGFKTFIKAINALLSKKYSISAADKEKSIRLFKLLSRTTIYTSVLLAFLGIIRMLGELQDISAVGPNVALALYSIFQGAFINVIIINPAINILETRYNTEEKTVISEKQVIDKLMELCYRQGISPEEILNADEIDFKKHH